METTVAPTTMSGRLKRLVVGWVWKKEDMRAELTAEGGVDKATYPVVRFLLRYVCPILVSTVFIFGIMDFVKGLNAAPAEPEAKEVVIMPAKELQLNMSSKTRKQFEEAKMRKPALSEKMLKLKVVDEKNETK